MSAGKSNALLRRKMKDKEENCWNWRNKQGKASESRKKRGGSDWKEKISRTDV